MLANFVFVPSPIPWTADTHVPRGIPESLMKAKLGGEQAFLEAQKKGDIQPVQHDSGTFWVWRELRVGKVTGASSSIKITNGGQTNIENYERAAEIISALDWALPTSTPKAQASLQKGILPESYAEQVQKATQAFSKAISLATNVIRKAVESERGQQNPVLTSARTNVEQYLSQAMEEQGKLQRLFSLQQMPKGEPMTRDNMMKLLQESALCLEGLVNGTRSAQRLLS